MASSTAGVDIEDGTGAGARTSRVRLVIAEPWWARLLRCCSYLATYATRMQRARFTRPGHKASWAIGVRVPTVNQSRGAPFLLNKLWLKRTLWCLLTMQIYPDSILIFLQGINGVCIFDASFSQNCICWILFGTLTIIFNVVEDFFGKVIESRYFSICICIQRPAQIISNFRKLLAKLLISKMAGDLSLSIFFKLILLLAPSPYRPPLLLRGAPNRAKLGK